MKIGKELSLAKPRLIVSDIDGTLLDETEVIQVPQMKELARLIEAKKLTFTLASGREKTQVADLRRLLELDTPIITCNGAAAGTEDQYLWLDSIDPQLIQPLVKKADALGMTVIFSLPEVECSFRRTPFVEETIRKYGRFQEPFLATKEDWSDVSIQKLLIIDSVLDNGVGVLLREFADSLQELSVVNYNNRSLDIGPAGCSKATGVRRLAGKLGIDLADVMVFGDSYNDLEMLQEVGFGVAVGNAVPELKAVADYVSVGHYLDGVLEVLGQIGVEGKGGLSCCSQTENFITFS
jgi:Cof subfamily protein (haloacid dehalogenase superfamily)